MGINGEAIWKAMERDADLMEHLPTEEHRAVVREYITERLEEAIGHMLDKEASLKTVLETQIAYSLHFTESKTAFRLMALDMDEDEVPVPIRLVAVAIQRKAAQELLTTAEDIEGYLKEHGATEFDALVGIGLSMTTASMIIARLLTIGDVLRMQPTVIVDPGVAAPQE